MTFLLRMLTTRLISAHIICPTHSDTSELDKMIENFGLSQKMTIWKAAQNNIPDENSVSATKEVINELQKAQNNKLKPLVVNLISGGGSALLCHPIAGLPLRSKVEIIRKLSLSGASIQELNTVRTALSIVKGGQLLQRIPKDSIVLNFVMSDIVGDPLGLIASGPTISPKKLTNIRIIGNFGGRFHCLRFFRSDQIGLASDILDKYGCCDILSNSVSENLNS